MGDDIPGEAPDDIPGEVPGDGQAPDGEGAATALPPRAESWRRRSATGALLTGLAFGLRDALEPERQEPSIVQETSGLPPEDLPVEADLGGGPPRRNTVRVRPWLLTDDDGGDAGEAVADRPSPVATPTPARRVRARSWRRRR